MDRLLPPTTSKTTSDPALHCFALSTSTSTALLRRTGLNCTQQRNEVPSPQGSTPVLVRPPAPSLTTPLSCCVTKKSISSQYSFSFHLFLSFACKVRRQVSRTVYTMIFPPSEPYKTMDCLWSILYNLVHHQFSMISFQVCSERCGDTISAVNIFLQPSLNFTLLSKKVLHSVQEHV